MALTGRKKVAKSKLMVASNSQQRHIFRHMVSFNIPIKPWPQQPHILQKPLRKRVNIGHGIPVTSIPVLTICLRLYLGLLLEATISFDIATFFSPC